MLLIGVVPDRTAPRQTRYGFLNQLYALDTRHLARCIDVFGLGGNVVIHRGKGFTRLTHRALMRRADRQMPERSLRVPDDGRCTTVGFRLVLRKQRAHQTTSHITS